jgi:hypothetical protein
MATLYKRKISPYLKKSSGLFPGRLPSISCRVSQAYHCNFRHFPQLPSERIGIRVHVKNTENPRIDNGFGTERAWFGGTVKFCPSRGRTYCGGLNDGIQFRMTSPANLMALSRRNITFLPEAPDIRTVRYSPGSSVITGTYDVSFPNDDRSHFTSQTGTPKRHGLCNRHKILIPTGSHKNLPIPALRT